MRCHFSSSALLETTGWHYHINRPVRGHHRLSHHPHKSTEDKLCKSLYTMGKKTTLTERYGPPNHLQRRWGFRLKWRTCIKWADWIWHLINSAIIKEEKEHRLNVRAEKYSGWSLWLFNELARYKGGSSQDISTYFLWQLSIHGNRLKVLDYPSIHLLLSDSSLENLILTDYSWHSWSATNSQMDWPFFTWTCVWITILLKEFFKASVFSSILLWHSSLTAPQYDTAMTSLYDVYDVSVVWELALQILLPNLAENVLDLIWLQNGSLSRHN